MRAKFFVVRKIKSIDKVPRNVGLMTRDKVRCGMRCAKKDSCERERERREKRERKKERKRAKKSRKSRQKRENLNSFLVFFFRRSFLFFLVSLSLLSL